MLSVYLNKSDSELPELNQYLKNIQQHTKDKVCKQNYRKPLVCKKNRNNLADHLWPGLPSPDEFANSEGNRPYAVAFRFRDCWGALSFSDASASSGRPSMASAPSRIA